MHFHAVEASTVGCAFCSSHDIHHGLNFFGYHNGREDDAKTLLSQTKELREFIRKWYVKALRNCFFVYLVAHISNMLWSF
jgi:hypothetical protein